MTAYRVGDIPGGADVFDLPSGVPAGYTTVVGVLTDPDGAPVELTGASFVLGRTQDDWDPDNPDQTVTVGWGTVTPFTVPGRHLLTISLSTDSTGQTLPPYPVIVEEEDGWHTLASIRAAWVDAPTDDDTCHELLAVAKGAVVAFAPTLTEDAIVPANYRRGQYMQARDTWNASKVDPANAQIGADTFTIRPFPLDWSVKQVLRPKPAVPPVG